MERENGEKRILFGEAKQIAFPLFGICTVFSVSYLLQQVLSSLLKTYAPALFDNDWVLMAMSSLPMYLVGMPLSLLLHRTVPSTPPEKKKLSRSAFFGYFALALLLTDAGRAVGILINLLVGGVSGSVPENELRAVADATSIPCQILFIVILAPIFEEIFFRKLLLDRWGRFGQLPASLLGGLVFGLVHGNFYQFFYAAAVGILLSHLYLKTGRVSLTILLHALLNFCGTVLLEWVELLLFAEDERLFLAGLLLLFFIGVAFFLSFAFFLWFWRRRRELAVFEKASHPLTHAQWRRVLLLNPGVWLFLCYTIYLFF